ncbi:MAG: NAD-dependent epimerase/dehydratase family protein [Chitinophagia bacterium]|nr:NAD-dependent epimerase/dehydratase family protein [Chitinophagia bacterium]
MVWEVLFKVIPSLLHLIETVLEICNWRQILNIDSDSSKETDSLNPSSIYSSTKASSDLIVLASYHTHKFPVLVTRCCNNYGPGQHDEKFIPVIINSAINNKNIPVYGNGQNMREWIYVDDHANAIIDLSEKGEIGEIYNIGSAFRLDNISLAKHILKIDTIYEHIPYDRPLPPKGIQI